MLLLLLLLLLFWLAAALLLLLLLLLLRLSRGVVSQCDLLATTPLQGLSRLGL